MAGAGELALRDQARTGYPTAAGLQRRGGGGRWRSGFQEWDLHHKRDADCKPLTLTGLAVRQHSVDPASGGLICLFFFLLEAIP